MFRFAACAVILAGAAFISGCSGTDTPECAPGQYYDQNMQMCTAGGGGPAPQCPPGQMWNGAQCVPGGAQGGPPQQCPPDQAWNGTQCVPAGGPGPQPQPQGGACAVQDMGGAGGPVAEQAVRALAAQHIPAGAQPVGGVMVGNFQAGQCMETPINVELGKCYTIVGASVGTVTDLDIEIVPNVAIPGLGQQVIAQDQDDAPTAVLGGKPNCWTGIPAPMKLIVRVAAGQGLAGAQIYAK